MKSDRTKIIFTGLFLLSLFSGYFCFHNINRTDILTAEECTIGVVSASSTTNGRPLLWKIRDNSDLPNNGTIYDTTCQYNFIAVVNNGDTSVWMGVNEKGLAIANATSKDLPAGNSGYSNGTLMRAALGYCKTVYEFEDLLIETNEIGRKTRANFALIDSTGEAVIFETSGDNYYKFDASDILQAPNGYLIRTNFSITGGGNEGIQRYQRTEQLIQQLYIKNELNYESLIKHHFRDFSDDQSNPITIPYSDKQLTSTPFGYINSNYSVCRSKSISAVVINGTNFFEPAKYSTMWTAIGQPASTIAFPLWCVGETPELTRGSEIAPIFKTANEVKSLLFDIGNSYYIDTYKLRDDLGNGVFKHYSNIEEFIIKKVKLVFGDGNYIPNNELLQLENELAELVHRSLNQTKNNLLSLMKLAVRNKDPYEPFDDINPVNKGNILQLIDAGTNKEIDTPVTDTLSKDFGMPGGDDKLIGNDHFMGENSIIPNMFYFPVLLWPDEPSLPSAGSYIYLRVFDNKTLKTANKYGNSQLYIVQRRAKQEYNPAIVEIKSLRTDKGSISPEENFADIENLQLFQNYPNPFNPTTKIKFTILNVGDANFATSTKVSLKVYDILGNEVATLVNEDKPAGKYEIKFDAETFNLSSGIYFYMLVAGNYSSSKKMILLH